MPAFVLVSHPGIDIDVQKRLLIYLFTATFCELEYYSKLVVFTFSHNLHSGDQKEARNSSRKFRQGGRDETQANCTARLSWLLL